MDDFLQRKNALKIASIISSAFILATLPVAVFASEISDQTGAIEFPVEVIDNFLFNIDDETISKVLELEPLPAVSIPPPILFGVRSDEIQNTWHHRRSGGRLHEGADFITHKGDLIISPTEAVVTNIGYDNMGGNFVITANPGGEQFYYAHLDKVAENLKRGTKLSMGDLIGYVGDSGNAKYSGSHLHFGIYFNGKAIDPHPRFTVDLDVEQKISMLGSILESNPTDILVAIGLVDKYRGIFINALNNKYELPSLVKTVLANEDIIQISHAFSAEIDIGTQNESVSILQRHLMKYSSGPATDRLKEAGATGYFGEVTKEALAEYQRAVGISPASGYFGPLTKARLLRTHFPEASTFTKNVTSSTALTYVSVPYALRSDLDVGSEGDEVRWLQEFLIQNSNGPKTQSLKKAGPTGYFGLITQGALAEFQNNVGISPAQGYFGPITKSFISAL